MRPKLQYYSQGPAVTELQTLLNQLMPLALPKLVVDGKFGERTARRVREFQASRGLVADAIVGPKTWAALDGKAPPKPGATLPLPSSAPFDHQVKAVGDGTSLRCTFGSALSTLRVPGLPRAAVITDCTPFTNIPPFGLCRSMSNPLVASATVAAQAGNLSQQPSTQQQALGVIPASCIPAIPSCWSTGGGKLELVGTPPQPALNKSSLLPCAWGGLIQVV